MRFDKSVFLKARYALAICIACGFISVWAQEKKEVEKKKAVRIPVYLGKSNIADTAVSKKVFDSLLRQGLTSHDTAGREYTVSSFLFTYGERNLYEDSIGNLIVLTDLMSYPVKSPELQPFLLENITERSKAGDTVYFDDVIVTAPEGYNALGKAMRLVITK